MKRGQDPRKGQRLAVFPRRASMTMGVGGLLPLWASIMYCTPSASGFQCKCKAFIYLYMSTRKLGAILGTAAGLHDKSPCFRVFSMKGKLPIPCQPSPCPKTQATQHQRLGMDIVCWV